MIRRYSALIMLLAITSCHLYGKFPDLSSFGPESSPFLTEIQLREKQLKEQQQALEEFKKEEVGASDSIKKRASDLNKELEGLDIKLKEASPDEVESLNKRKNKIKERNQNLTSIQEIWVQSREVLQKHVELLKEVLEELQKKSPFGDINVVTSLEDIKEVQGKITGLESKINTETSNKEALSRQKQAAEASIALLRKEEETLGQKQKELLEKPADAEAEDVSVADIKEKAALLGMDLVLLKERKELYEITSRKLDYELSFKGDEVKLLEMRYLELKKMAVLIHGRLLIDEREVEVARKELDKQKKIALDKKANWNKQKAVTKAKQDALKVVITSLDSTLKEMKEKGEADTSKNKVVETNRDKEEIHFSLLQKQLDLFDAKKTLEDEKVALKELQAKIVDIRYGIQTETDKSKFDGWISDFGRRVKNQENEIGALEKRREEISNFLVTLSVDDIDGKIENVKKQKDTVFKNDLTSLSEVIMRLGETKMFLQRIMNVSQRIFLIDSEIIRYKKDIITQCGFIIKELETKRFDIWKRSPGAIALSDIWKSVSDAEEFVSIFFWRLPKLIHPMIIWDVLRQFGAYDYLGMLVLIALFYIFFLVLQPVLLFIKKSLSSISIKCKGSWCLFLNILTALFVVVLKHYKLFATWLFLQLDILINLKQFFGPLGDFVSYTDSEYLSACFYMFSIFVLVFLSRKLVGAVSELNRETGFTLPEGLETKYLALLKPLLYTSAVVIPFIRAFTLMAPRSPQLPNVLFAAYTIILQGLVVALALIHKDDVLNLVRVETRFFVWLKELLKHNYRPALLFLFCLLVLSNPYFGYFNLAYHLLFAVPISALIVYGLFFVHSRIRRRTTSWFIEDVDGEYVDRFDHAKAYYGIFIILTFLMFAVITLIVLAKIWGVLAPWEKMLELVQDKWTLDMPGGKKLGVVQFVAFTFFVAGGFVVSTLLDKFVLERTFDILRMDLGVRNTISSITHYIIVYFAIVLGLTSVHLGDLIVWVSGGAIVGVGLAAKDFLADLIAGFLILLERPVEIGSFIETGEIIGTVYKISPRSTTLRTALHKMIIIPNSELLNTPIINWTYSRAYVGFDLDMLISYASDPEKVKELAVKIIQDDHRILKNPPSVFRVDEFESDGFTFRVRVFISARRAREKWTIASDMRGLLMKAFRDNNIEIAFPQRVIHSSKDKGMFGEPGSQVSINFHDDKEGVEK